MIAVYRIQADVDAFRWFALRDGESIEPFLRWDATPREAEWVPVALEEGGTSKPEAAFCGTNIVDDPLVDGGGRTLLGGQLGDHVEFLACPTPSGDRWIGHVLYVSECIDADASEWRGSPELPTGVFRYAFRGGALASLRAPVFRIHSVPGGPFCTAVFKDRYEGSGLTGLRFDEVLRLPDT